MQTVNLDKGTYAFWRNRHVVVAKYRVWEFCVFHGNSVTTGAERKNESLGKSICRGIELEAGNCGECSKPRVNRSEVSLHWVTCWFVLVSSHLFLIAPTSDGSYEHMVVIVSQESGQSFTIKTKTFMCAKLVLAAYLSELGYALDLVTDPTKPNKIRNG